MGWKKVARDFVVFAVWIAGIFYTGKTIKGNYVEYMSYRSFMATEAFGEQGFYYHLIMGTM